jgi:hypothetical protein
MPEEPIATQALQLLSKHFELPEGVSIELTSQEQGSREEARSQLIKVLTPVVSRMLDQSFEQLIHILYRIDLSESKVVELLEKSTPDKLATLLTEAIVDRQLEKAKWREKYRRFSGE